MNIIENFLWGLEPPFQYTWIRPHNIDNGRMDAYEFNEEMFGNIFKRKHDLEEQL